MENRTKREHKPTTKFLNYYSTERVAKEKPLPSTIAQTSRENSNEDISQIRKTTSEPMDVHPDSDISSQDSNVLDTSSTSSSSDIRRSSRKPKPSSKLQGFVRDSIVPHKKVVKNVFEPKPKLKASTSTNVKQIMKVQPSMKERPTLTKSKDVAVIQPMKRDIPKPEPKVISARNMARLTSIRNVIKPTASSMAKQRANKRAAEEDPVVPSKIPRQKSSVGFPPRRQLPVSSVRPKTTKAPLKKTQSLGASKMSGSGVKAIKELPKSKEEMDDKTSSSEVEVEETGGRDKKDTLEKFLLMGSKVAKAISETLDHNEEELLCRSSAFERKCLELVEALSSTGQDIAEDDMCTLLRLLEEEQIERKTYRQTFLESLRASHLTNMALYTQMLRLLKTL